MVERFHGMEEVWGSIPHSSTRQIPRSQAWGFLLSQVVGTVLAHFAHFGVEVCHVPKGPLMGYGDGTIIREDSGRYRGVRTIKGKRVFVRGTTRAEVREKLKAREEAAASGLKASPRLSVAEVLEAWLVEASPKPPG